MASLHISNHHFSAAVIMAVAVATAGFVLWTLQAEPYKIHDNGAIRHGKEVPMMNGIRLMNDAMAFSPKLSRWLVPLSVGSMKQVATSMTGGLTDFVDHVDWDSLDLIIASAERDFSILGRIALKEWVVLTLASHLKMTSMLRNNPEIREQRIDQPIIITGHTRSSTTFLLNTLVQLYGGWSLGYVQYWESIGKGGFSEDVSDEMAFANWNVWILKKTFPLLDTLHGVNEHPPTRGGNLLDGDDLLWLCIFVHSAGHRLRAEDVH